MWIYEKKLQYPVKIANPNPRLAGLIITALGGPDGETGAAMRYLNQRYTMPDGRVIATLTDVGAEELGHQEMVASLFISSRETLPMMRSKPAVLINTTSITATVFFLARRPAFRSVQWQSHQRAMPSQASRKTLRQSKRRVQCMIIFFAFPTIPT